MRSKFLFGALVAAAAFATPSVAATVVGSAAVSIVGVSANAPSIGVGTTFTNTVFSVVGSSFGDFGPVTGANLTISPLTATFGSAFNFTSSFGDFVGTVQSAAQQGSVNDRTVSAFVLGIFTPMGVISGFTPGPASATFSFTQTGSNSAVSGSFTLASPPSVVPEPESWLMLIAGFGLIGAASRRRQKAAVTA